MLNDRDGHRGLPGCGNLACIVFVQREPSEGCNFQCQSQPWVCMSLCTASRCNCLKTGELEQCSACTVSCPYAAHKLATYREVPLTQESLALELICSGPVVHSSRARAARVPFVTNLYMRRSGAEAMHPATWTYLTLDGPDGQMQVRRTSVLRRDQSSTTYLAEAVTDGQLVVIKVRMLTEDAQTSQRWRDLPSCHLWSMSRVADWQTPFLCAQNMLPGLRLQHVAHSVTGFVSLESFDQHCFGELSSSCDELAGDFRSTTSCACCWDALCM